MVRRILAFFVYILLVVSFFEFFSRYGYKLFPYEDFQRYSVQSDKLITGGILKLKINGRSAMGKFYKREPIQIAFFGTSSLFYPVPNNKTWPELLRQSSNKRIHVDNFGMFNESTETLYKKLDNLCLFRRFYDISIIQLSHLGKEPVPSYHNKFKPELNKLFQSYQQIKKWYNRHKKTIINPVQNAPYFFGNELEVFFIQTNLQATLLKDLFIRYEYTMNKNLEYENQLVSKIINKAHCISNKIFWITEPVAWAENMLNSYESLPLYMKNISNSSGFIFLNHEAFGRYMLQQKNIIQNILKEREDITLIDSYAFIKKKILITDNLFIFPTHLSEKGHRLMFNEIQPKLMEYISQSGL